MGPEVLNVFLALKDELSETNANLAIANERLGRVIDEHGSLSTRVKTLEKRTLLGLAGIAIVAVKGMDAATLTTILKSVLSFG